MKKLLYTFAASFFTCSAIAQITISTLPTISAGKIDSCTLPTATALLTLPSMAPVINGTWDLGNTTIQSSFYTYTYRTKTPGFSTASFSDSLTYGLSSAPNLGYKVWRNVQQTSTGVVIPGEEIITRQAQGLGTVTGNSLDSIIFPLQAMTFNTPLPIIKFPATMSTKWGATTNRALNFNLTVTAAGLNNAPGLHKQNRTYIDSVVGWGRMKVPIAGKAASAYIQVLQVQHTELTVDSFFLNGVAASAIVLTPLGLSQGLATTSPRTFFYRSAGFRPLVEAVHGGPSFISTPSKFYMHAQDLPDPVAVRSVSALGDITVYPNPVRNGKMHIDVPGNTKAGWSYTLININGQQVVRAALSLTAATRTTEISLPSGLPSGIYYLTLINADEPMSVLPITVD